MRFFIILGLLLLTGRALAEPSLTAQDLFERGLRWEELGQPQRAIESFEQSYLERNDAICLYYMAGSYERLARIPTRTVPEALDSKQRAFDLYKRFVEQRPAEASPQLLETARTRIEPLRQEIEELAPRVMTEQRLSAQKLDAILLGQKVITDKLDAIQDLLTRILERVELRKAGGNNR